VTIGHFETCVIAHFTTCEIAPARSASVPRLTRVRAIPAWSRHPAGAAGNGAEGSVPAPTGLVVRTGDVARSEGCD